MDSFINWIVPELIAFACGYILHVFASQSGIRHLSQTETAVLLEAMRKHLTELEYQEKLGLADQFEIFQTKTIIELIKV